MIFQLKYQTLVNVNALKYQLGSVSIIAILFVIAVSASSLLAVNKIYKDSTYKQESDIISQRVLRFSADANSIMANKYDCRFLQNAYMISNGLIPKGWEYDKNITGYNLNALIGIKYKYGNVFISSDLSVAELPSAQLGPYDGYRIRLQNFPAQRIPRFISQLIQNFDFILIDNEVIKDEGGLLQTNYNSILSNETGVSTITLVKWGC